MIEHRSSARRCARGVAAWLGVALVCAACPELPVVLPVLDAGAGDGGAADAPRQDRPAADTGRLDAVLADVGCGPDTPMYGEACGECGQYLCDLSNALICVDPGFNSCGVCGELDESAGRLGRACGSCGLIECTADGLATRCVGEHAPNVCGGCGSIPVIDDGTGTPRDKGPPGAACSSCGTGTWRCSADLDDLICRRGRGLTSCGDCERCVLYHARMDQRFGGAYLKADTLALVEDTGTDLDVGSSELAGTNLSLVFDPLVAGPGASGLPQAYVMLSPSASPDDPGAMLLFPEFAASADGIQSDELRRYTVYSWMSLEVYRHVLVYDYLLEALISAGELIPGAPTADLDGGVLDGAEADASPPDAAPSDVLPADQQVPDSRVDDGGLDAGAAGVDGPTPVDASAEDLGPLDARAEDAAAVDVRGEDLGPEDSGEDAR